MNKLILIIDDEPQVLDTIESTFVHHHMNFDVIKAPNGAVALNILQKRIPDLIITDWDMPKMDGIEFINQLKPRKETSDIPVIMCTGKMTSSENLNTALMAGAVDYIRKPIDEIELIARTKACLLLAENHNKIKDINATKDRLFSIIAHDLLSPFNAILGLSKLLVESDDMTDDKRTMLLQSINISSSKAHKLVHNLLLWAQNQTDRIKFRPVQTNVNTIITEIIALMQIKADLKDLELKANLEANLIANVDINMISLTIRNLICNAIKFTHRGGHIIVHARNTIVNNNKMIEISIEDNGIGIHDEQQQQLFKLDQPSSTIGTEKETGSGLGLILCKEFVEKHKGTIWFETEVNKGSTFIIQIRVDNK